MKIGRTRWRRFKWAVRIGVLLLIIGYPLIVGLDGCFYYPNDKVYHRPETFGLDYEDVRFPTRDGLTLAGWFMPAEGEPRGTVIHFHGNAGNITGHLPLVWWLPGRGYNLLMFDYRGYGESEGRVTRAGTITDGHAAIDFALSRADVRGRPLFVYGQSLGGAVGTVVAAERAEVAAVVAESTFSGYRRIGAAYARRLLYFKWLGKALATVTLSDGYDPIDFVGRIGPRPLLVVVAGSDKTCFPELGRELYDAAGQPKEFWLVPGAEHLGIDEHHSREQIERITSFFERAGP